MTTTSVTPLSIVQEFVTKFEAAAIQDALNRLEADFDKHRTTKVGPTYDGGNGAAEEAWAEDLYMAFRKDEADARANALNMDRKHCLELLYEMIRTWEDYQQNKNHNDNKQDGDDNATTTEDYHPPFSAEFEQALLTEFQKDRLVRILRFCLPMDRAQALYKMRHGGVVGMPWFCKLHIADIASSNDDAAVAFYAKQFPQEKQEWTTSIAPKYMKDDPTFCPPMNHKLFHLIFSQTLGLWNHHENDTSASKNPYAAHFVKWARPMESPAPMPIVGGKAAALDKDDDDDDDVGITMTVKEASPAGDPQKQPATEADKADCCCSCEIL